ncbi:MAG: hypothetical protein ACTIBE_07240 [Latilactobacillus curvatus]
MLVIQYVNGQTNAEKVYQKAAEFVANQQLEVPDFEDYVAIKQVTLDGQPLTLADATMRGLYNYLNRQITSLIRTSSEFLNSGL